MAAVAIASPFGLQNLFKDISPKFDSTESKNVVQSFQVNYGGKFCSLGSHDLLQCLQLLAKHGYVSRSKVKLIEDYVAPKSSKEELIKEVIRRYKASRPAVKEEEFQGRDDEIKDITKQLESKETSVLNLFGSSGVGKTRLANEVCSQWRGNYQVFDLREVKSIKAMYYHILSSLELAVPVGFVNLNYAVTKVRDRIKTLKSGGHSVLFFLDNVDKFTAGQEMEGKSLKSDFIQFLEKLFELDDKGERCALKLLLTSRIQFTDATLVDNFEVMSLERSSSEKILFPEGSTDVQVQQKDNLIGISKGFPIVLKGMGAILRQERKSVDDLIARVAATPEKSKLQEDAKEMPVSFEDEGVDTGQISVIREMFSTLPSDRLKVSAVVISLFHGPFTVETAAKVLGIDQSEAFAQLEGLVTSAIISVVDEEAKERKYDIHPLLQKYADSIKSHENFSAAYMKAKGRYYELFMSKMAKIAKLIEPQYVKAFSLFETDRANFEFALEISLQPEYYKVPREFHENALIASLFMAMLTEGKMVTLFHSWAEICEDDGKSGSLGRTQLKCWEARQVADMHGTEKAFVVLEEALRSMEKVEDKSTESFKLTRALYLHTEGEILWRDKDFKKALESLQLSLTFSEELLKEHTDLARCYNAVGNCFFHLGQPMEALEFYEKAYKMQERLAGSEHHFDMPMYKNQIGTAYEGLRKYDKAVEYYRDALRLLKELNLSGFQDEAHFCRNLANALMFLKKYSEATEPSMRAYTIRKNLLKNHPHTVRSIFQRAVLQANLRDFGGALKLFLEAWEMEKSLEVGNHSRVWRKIITGVEDFLDEGEQKKTFQKDAFKFCEHFWIEKKKSQRFAFSESNKEIIDTLMHLASDEKDKYEVQKEQLWFYEGMYNATKEEHQDCDLEPESSALHKTLGEMTKLLEHMIHLCKQLEDHKKEELYADELQIFPSFSWGIYNHVMDMPMYKNQIGTAYEGLRKYDKAVEYYRDALRLLKELNLSGFQDEAHFCRNLANALMFLKKYSEATEPSMRAYTIRKNLLKNHPHTVRSIFQRAVLQANLRDFGGALKLFLEAWEMEKSLEVGNHSRVWRKIITGVEDFLDEGEQKKTFQKDAFKFCEHFWIEKKKSQRFAFSESNKEIIDTLMHLVSDEKDKYELQKEQLWFYEGMYNATKEEHQDCELEPESSALHKTLGEMTKLLEHMIHLCKQLEDHKKEELYADELQVVQDGRVPEVTSRSKAREQEKSAEVVELSSTSTDQDSVQKEEVVRNADKRKTVIKRGKIEDESETWNLAEAGASITFNLGTMTKSLTITCSLWGPGALSPPIGSNELLVSNVIELSHDGPPDLEFMENAPRRINVALLHSASNFKGYEVVIKQLVDPENNEWKALETTNIWRASVPDYPNVTVAIPWNSLPAATDFHLTLKVQEAPSIDHDMEGMFVGPILHISYSHDVKLSEPAKISVPLALTDSEVEPPKMPYSGQLRILHFKSREKSEGWTDITDHLEMPAVIKDGIVTFQVKTLCRFWPWWLKTSASFAWKYVSPLYDSIMKQHAGFLAFLCNDTVPGRYLLYLFCFPQHLRSRVNSDISSTYFVNMQGEGTSQKPLSNGDETFVSLSNGFEVHGAPARNAEEVVLKFLGTSAQSVQHSSGKRPSVESSSGRPIAALKKRRRLLAGSSAIENVTLTGTAEEEGADKGELQVPSNEDLEWLSQRIAQGWKPLGRRLDIKEEKLTAFHKENEEYTEKAYKMLLHWKQKTGSAATFEIMYNALCHECVNRKDLAETFFSRMDEVTD
ncbi:Nephrocystin-3 [Stylophora pistillata]|uniref:Nephrocystin-3 n=1 Tax=Stylophora pistillata TaxID=50429 RepID=A0A2B4RT19_STYPI|nr:Nephrocystin-3 [Stylophora pistillata]